MQSPGLCISMMLGTLLLEGVPVRSGSTSPEIFRMQLSELALLFRQSSRPLFHIGQGVRLAGAEEIFFRLIESLQVPFVTARNANDICSSDHPLYVGRPGTFAQRGANFAVQTCDLYIAIGTRLSLTQTGYNSKDYARNAYVVMVDVDEAELTKPTVRVDLPIRADAKDFIETLRYQLEHIITLDE